MNDFSPTYYSCICQLATLKRLAQIYVNIFKTFVGVPFCFLSGDPTQKQVMWLEAVSRIVCPIVVLIYTQTAKDVLVSFLLVGHYHPWKPKCQLVSTSKWYSHPIISCHYLRNILRYYERLFTNLLRLYLLASHLKKAYSRFTEGTVEVNFFKTLVGVTFCFLPWDLTILTTEVFS